MTNFLLNTSIENIKGVGPKVKIQLEKIGIETIQDALFYLLKVMKTGQKLQKYRMLNLEMLIKSKERFLKVKFIILVEELFMQKLPTALDLFK